MECWYKDCLHTSSTHECTYREIPLDEAARKIWLRYAGIRGVRQKRTPVVCLCHFEGTNEFPTPHYEEKNKRKSANVSEIVTPLMQIEYEEVEERINDEDDHQVIFEDEEIYYLVDDCETSVLESEGAICIDEAYELEFEDDTLEDERKFYVQTYPNVNMVADRRLHCTTCDTHIGCAVANEQTIRMHPVLRVTHCRKCHTFYNSGEFSKGEDGSELYCRWCGQGGEVYCCSKCPYVFCKKCILQNLSRGVITEIETNDDWQCFRCSPKVMWQLRAQHWALVNYIEKTKKRILADEKDDEKIYELMNKDPTLCCKDKKSQRSRRAAKSKRRRRVSSTSDSDSSIPEPKRVADHSAVLPKMVTTNQQKSKKQLDELVCTPDILSMFSDPVDEPTAPRPAPATKSTSRQSATTITSNFAAKSTASHPPPLIIRQLPTSSSSTASPASSSAVQTVRFPNRQFSAVPRVAAPPPAYYTVNGFRVDLNAAAQQETYRLPNGKLIQVKKQTSNQMPGTGNRNPPLQSRANVSNPNPYSIRFNIQQNLPVAAPVQIQQHVQPPVAHQASAAQALHQQHIQQQQQILNGIPNVPIVPIATLQTQAPVLTRYPNTPVGKAQTELEKEIHGAQEICQQIVGKCNTLMKSNAYKSVRNFNDVKDLHLHLSYLFTYTIDKFTTLQAKCTDAMKSLTNAHEAANKLADKKNKYTNADDDLEVVESPTVCIEIDSDDEADAKKASTSVTAEKSKSKQPRKTNHQPKPTNDIAPIEVVDNIDEDELELPLPPPLESPTQRQVESPTESPVESLPTQPRVESPTQTPVESSATPTEEEIDPSYDRDNDEKLRGLPQVVLEKDEAVERKLKEILEQEHLENGATSPVNDEPVVSVNDSIDQSESEKTETNAEHRSVDNGTNDSNETTNEVSEDNGDKDDKEEADKAETDATTVDLNQVDESNEIVENVENVDSTKVDDSENIEDDHKVVDDSDKTEQNDDCDKNDETDDKGDELTNGQNNIDFEPMDVDCVLNNTDVSCPESPALTDNLDNDLLDEMDHQNNLTDNSFENISSPDMFDDMSKNGFDKATENIVTLSTENADPDLV